MDGSYNDTSNVGFSISQLATLTVTSPNGSETWGSGSAHNITWDAANVTGELEISLFQDDSYVGTIENDLDPTDGYFTWTVGKLKDGRNVQPGSGYKIKIQGENISDISDESFSISIICIISPNGIENWLLGSNQIIAWNASLGITNKVDLYLYKNGSNLGLIASNLNPVAGNYLWEVGRLKNGTYVSPDSGYAIKINVQGEEISDLSDSTFKISSMSITSPNGGENLQIGSSMNITWTSIGITGKVELALFENVTNIGIIQTDIDLAAGYYPWTVGNLRDGTVAAPGLGYKIRIKSQEEFHSDFSDSNFLISDNTQIAEIWLSNQSFTYTVSMFDPVSYDTFKIKNSGEGTLLYLITSEGSTWDIIKPDPYSGSSSGELDTIKIGIYPKHTAPGTKKTGIFRVFDINNSASNSPQYINFTIYGKPFKASIPNPSNGATNINLNPNLIWSTAEGAVKYKVNFGTNTLSYKTTTTNLSWIYTGMMYYNTIYQWRIDSVDANDKMTEGDVWNFRTKPSPTAVAINMGDPDQNDHVYRFDFPMGYTEPVSIPDRDGSVRRTKTLDDPYMCFKVSDNWVYQGYLTNQDESLDQLAVTIIYLDNGTGYLELQYDSREEAYKSGGIVYLQDTNTWKQHTYYVYDAYFGNRQNDGGDFRIARHLRGGLLYLDWVNISR